MENLKLYTSLNKLEGDIVNNSSLTNLVLDYSNKLIVNNDIQCDLDNYTLITDLVDDLIGKIIEKMESGIDLSNVQVIIADIGPVKDILEFFPNVIGSIHKLITFCGFFNVNLMIYKDKFEDDIYFNQMTLIA